MPAEPGSSAPEAGDTASQECRPLPEVSPTTSALLSASRPCSGTQQEVTCLYQVLVVPRQEGPYCLRQGPSAFQASELVR